MIDAGVFPHRQSIYFFDLKLAASAIRDSSPRGAHNSHPTSRNPHKPRRVGPANRRRVYADAGLFPASILV
jgi:hypothetical protein